MYTFYPLSDPSNNHGGLWTVLIILAFICWMMWYSETLLPKLATVVLVGWIGTYAYTESYKIVTPLNQKVTGELVGYVAEGYRESSGKTKVDKHRIYVIYRVSNTAEVMMNADAGVAYPKYAVLYKN